MTDSDVKLGEIAIIGDYNMDRKYFMVDNIGKYVHGWYISRFGDLLSTGSFLMKNYLPRETISFDDFIEKIKLNNEAKVKVLIDDLTQHRENILS